MKKLRFVNNLLAPDSSAAITLIDGGYDSLVDRLELIHQFKKLAANAMPLSAREMSFINRQLPPSEMIELVREYEFAIAQAALEDEATRFRERLRLKSKPDPG